MKVLITGCSSGFGHLASLRFARAGHSVVSTMRSPDKAVALRDLALSENLDIAVLELDVTDDHSVAACIEQALLRLGHIDVLINNAGVGGGGAVETLPDALVRSIFETNYFGTLRMVRAVLPSMRVRNGGHIINVTSMGGLVSVPYNSAYCASKHAVESLTESLALEVRQFGISVSMVEPGYYRTAMADNILATTSVSESSPYYDDERRALDAVPLVVDRGGDPEEVATALFELATSEDPPLRCLVSGSDLLTPRDNGVWCDMALRLRLPPVD